MMAVTPPITGQEMLSLPLPGVLLWGVVTAILVILVIVLGVKVLEAKWRDLL